MHILTRHSTNQTSAPSIVLQLGLGLVGQSIFKSLRASGYEKVYSAKLDWGDRAGITSKLAAAGEEIKKIAASTSAHNIHILWSAGKGGFGSELLDFDDETFAFNTLIFLTRELTGYFPQSVCFHLISSAGGLFEGQRCVDANSKPNPLRPYGQVKLEQEGKVWRLPDSIGKQIYRPSSVYGYNHAGGRMGLVVALVKKGLQGVPVHIYGRSDTLRDFVFVDDIGDFVSRKVSGGTRQYSTYFLTGGKPTSMFEMISTVQKILGKRLFFRFQPGPNNTLHMSFKRTVFPEGWSPTINAIGLKKTAQLIQRDIF